MGIVRFFLSARILWIVAALGVMFFLSSCSPVPYANVGQVAPMFKNKGEVFISGGYAQTDDAEGISLQVGAAVDSTWAVTSSFYSLKNLNGSDWDGNGSYFDLAFGRFGSFSKQRWVYDAYLGFGFGGIKNSYQTDKMNVGFIKPFIQGSFGYSNHWFEGAFTSRFAVVSYTKEDYSFLDSEYNMQAARFFDENGTQFVFEPGFLVRFGYRGVKAHLNYSISTFSGDFDYDVSVNNQFLSIGISTMISKRYLGK